MREKRLFFKSSCQPICETIDTFLQQPALLRHPKASWFERKIHLVVIHEGYSNYRACIAGRSDLTIAAVARDVDRGRRFSGRADGLDHAYAAIPHLQRNIPFFRSHTHINLCNLCFGKSAGPFCLWTFVRSGWTPNHGVGGACSCCRKHSTVRICARDSVALYCPSGERVLNWTCIGSGYCVDTRITPQKR